MSVDVIMPQMGESVTEGTITRWLIQVGETVERDQPLVEISTDKVDAEIPSPASGTLLKIHFAEGETVAVDEILALIGDSATVSEDRQESSAQPTPFQPEPPAPVAGAAAAETAPVTRTGSLEERVRRFSSPVVRRIADREGVDLDQVQGSGVHGRVTKSDILQYLEHREEKPASGGVSPDGGSAESGAASFGQPPSAPQVPPLAVQVSPSAPLAEAHGDRAPNQEPRGELVRASEPEIRVASSVGLEFSVPAFSEAERVELEPMSRMRRLTAAHMLYSQQTSAHVTTVFDADFSRVVSARDRAKEGFFRKTGTKLTFMPFLFRALLDGLRTYPKFNASISGTDVVFKQDVNLGMAVALDWGLIVPVIKNADQLNIVGLASQANDLAERARSKQLRPEEIQGGTFTVTNPGVFGSLFGTPIINQPQVAILCVGAIEKRPVVITDDEGNDGLGIRWMAYLALSYDHRLIDGADAELFMVRVKQTLTDSSWDELSAYSEA